ncbi:MULTISPECIES: type III secretion protein HrpB2 [Burkholderia]|uniref:Serine kinase n=1 Tax=Burkholderia savannae TaxID=1637837 RepID=A0ABR5T4S8_9BURK|nr:MULTISPECIES: type III secretion protein HrpB2 [Burkholderia]AOJ71171.1 serine kinase [Burkholderia savannae]AOJ84210.1 serine kinase [Burkholderia savannae]AOK49565.1 serine kinase [Burkholderia sp. MSMB617WGS]KGS08430.1 type III secretion protein HrpB2 [Burkholderia sp. ABCPW 111]KVG48761.1 serine kinase [Burkholderia sp. MSMB0265]
MTAPLSPTDLTRALDAAFSDAAAPGGPAAATTTAGTAAHDVPADVAGRFQALMSNATPAPPVAPAHDASAIAKLVETSDAAIRQVLDNAAYLSRHASELPMSQMFAASIQASAEATAMQIDLQAKMSVVTSTKDAIGSLMKNQ